MANIEFEFEEGRRFGKIKGTFTKRGDGRGVDLDVKHDLPPKRPAAYHVAPNEINDHNVLTIPDKEYRWCQTIDTNVPLGGVTSPYVDPRPSDDPGTPRPFYLTDGEHAVHHTRFGDRPSRNQPGAGTTTWRATLSLCAVNDKTVKRITTIHYGFDYDDTGTLTEVNPVAATAAQVTAHVDTLRSEFGSWTFE